MCGGGVAGVAGVEEPTVDTNKARAVVYGYGYGSNFRGVAGVERLLEDKGLTSNSSVLKSKRRTSNRPV